MAPCPSCFKRSALRRCRMIGNASNPVIPRRFADDPDPHLNMHPKAAFTFAMLFACSAMTSLAAQTPEQFVTAAAEAIASRRYDVYQLSSGRNRPALNLDEDRGATLIVMLREGIPLPMIARALGWTESKTGQRVQALLDAGFIARDGARYRARIAVLSADAVARYMPVRREAVAAAAHVIADSMPFIRRSYARIPGFENIPFEDESLLILSDVLLDNWQIRNVERDFIRAARPVRVGGQYYLFVEEHVPWIVGEPFGLYGNTGSGSGNINVGLYGNARSPSDLSSMPPDSLLTLARDGHPRLPVLHATDNQALDTLAAAMMPAIASILNAERPWLSDVYSQSPFAVETSFEEYLVFWYHVFYSAVTDRLMAEGFIRRPPSGNATYLVVY